MANYIFTRFYLRSSTTDVAKCSINVRVTVNGNRLTLGAVTTASGLDLPKSILIDKSHWDKGAQRVKPASPHAKALNDAIEACRKKIDKTYMYYEASDKRITSVGLKNIVMAGGRIMTTFQELMERFIEERKVIGTKSSTINTYRFKFRPVSEFLKSEGLHETPAEDFSPGTLKRFRTYLISQRGNKPRAADKTCQVVKTVLIWAAESELISKNPLLNIRIRVDKTPNLECLNQDELEVLRTAQLIPILRQTADCFRFACFTGLAYQDMKLISKANLQAIEGKECIVGYRLKTGTEYCIPVTQPVRELIDKYEFKLPLPEIKHYNMFIQQIMLLLGISKRITSHTARKTFADWCINEIGLSEEATIVAMGQKDAKELRPYRKTRPKRLLAEFPTDLLQSSTDSSPFTQLSKAS